MSNDYTQAPATLMLATNCVCCGRALVDAVSVELGIGPEILLSAKQEDENGELPIPDPKYNRVTVSAIAGVGYRFLEVFSVDFRFILFHYPCFP